MVHTCSLSTLQGRGGLKQEDHECAASLDYVQITNQSELSREEPASETKDWAWGWLCTLSSQHLEGRNGFEASLVYIVPGQPEVHSEILPQNNKTLRLGGITQ